MRICEICGRTSSTSLFCEFREFCGRTPSTSLFCRRVENNPPTDCTDLHRFTGAWEVPQNSQNSQNYKHAPSVRICEICGRTFSASLFCEFREFCGRTSLPVYSVNSVNSVGGHPLPIYSVNSVKSVGEHPLPVYSVNSVNSVGGQNIPTEHTEHTEQFAWLVHFLLWQAAKPSGDKCTP